MAPGRHEAVILDRLSVQPLPCGGYSVEFVKNHTAKRGREKKEAEM